MRDDSEIKLNTIELIKSVFKKLTDGMSSILHGGSRYRTGPKQPNGDALPDQTKITTLIPNKIMLIKYVPGSVMKETPFIRTNTDACPNQVADSFASKLNSGF